jgi:hypothetical protein
VIIRTFRIGQECCLHLNTGNSWVANSIAVLSITEEAECVLRHIPQAVGVLGNEERSGHEGLVDELA